LGEGGERWEQKSQEKNTTTTESTGRRLRQIEVAGTDDESNDNGSSKENDETETILPCEADLSLEELQNLNTERHCVRGLVGNQLALLIFEGSQECISSTTIGFHILAVSSLLLLHAGVVYRGFVCFFHIFRRRWNVTGVSALLESSLVGVSASTEIIGSCLTRHISVSETNEVLSCFLGWAEEDFSSFIDDENLVELFINTFTSLVQGDERGSLEDIGEDAK
jgi:hypothetical protein